MKYYRVYIETDKIEKIGEYDYEDMMFCLEYAIRVLHWDRKILVISHDTELDMDEVFYTYYGNMDEYMAWDERNKTKTK